MNHVFIIGSFVASCTVKVGRFPAPGESLQADSFLLEPGGKGFNMMVGVHRLGIPVKGVLAVGNDLVGSLAPKLVGGAGLPADLVITIPGISGGGVGFSDGEGESCLAVCPGANALLAATHMDTLHGQISAAAMVAAQFEVPDEPIAHAFQIAQRAGVPTLLNPSPFRPISRETLAATSIMVVNETEAAALAASEGFEIPAFDMDGLSPLAARLRVHGVKCTIVTMGPAGAIAYPEDRPPFFQPAFPARTVDTIGAGDAFNAGLLTALTEGQDIASAVRFAAACGAAATEHEGTLKALPLREHITV